MRRKICFITGSRAEYGLLRHLILESSSSKVITTQIIVTGSHLSKRHGMTINEIKEDKVKINAVVDLKLRGDKPKDIANSMSKAMKFFAQEFDKLKPDIVVVLGDRSEIYAAATSAMILRIPIAHIHGGEVTIGAYDDSLRHAITKLANLHFVATSEYKKRVIQLGENPKSVFNFGGLGVSAIQKVSLLSKKVLEKKLDFPFAEKNLLVCYHPETMLTEIENKENFQELLESLQDLKKTNIIFTMPNADAGNQIIITMIKDFVQKKYFAKAYKSLGQLNFFSLLKQVDGIIGNSSSGVLEAPSFSIATINIGNRQTGRTKSDSVIDCKPSKEQISKSIRLIYSKKYLEICKKAKNPYQKGNSSKKILQKLSNFPLTNLQSKHFYDLPNI
jgi:GDP/UDP-N,N'-diacetylbacillosamine 2-epimerase (hydrolysing)